MTGVAGTRHSRWSMRLAAVLRNLPIIHDQAVDDLANAGGPSVAASSSRERRLLILPTFSGHIRKAILAQGGLCHGTQGLQEVQPGVQARGGSPGSRWDRPKAQIARELGIRVNQLRKWRLDFEEEERTGAPKRVPTSEDDLGRLRRENAKLKEENEILKKAAIYFARELT
jgi:transposase